MEILDNMVMYFNSLNAKRYNSDYDGDVLGCYAVHSMQGKQDALNHMTPQKNIVHEHNLELIDTVEHESIQAAYMLTVMAFKPYETSDENFIPKKIKNHLDLEVNIDLLINQPNLPIELTDFDIILPYNVVLLNKALNTESILYKEHFLNKKNLYKLLMVLLDEVGNDLFHDHLWNFNKFLLWCSTIVDYCNTSFDLDHFVVQDDQITAYKKTLINEPYTGFHQNQILFDNHVSKIINHNKENVLSNVSNSGARIKNVQLLKAASNNGIPTDINGRAFSLNIQESLLEGLTEKQFFTTGDSARLALAQRQDSIPKGGELQRKIYFITGFLQLGEENDCGSTQYFNIYVNNQHHLKSLYGRYYKKNDDPDNHELLRIRLKDTQLIGTTIQVRAPYHCKCKNYKICKTCFGTKQPDSIYLGSAIGAYIAESIIQSILRTHHFSGAFITQILKEFNIIIHKLKFESPDIVIGNKNDIIEYEQFLLNNYYKPENFRNVPYLKHVDPAEYTKSKDGFTINPFFTFHKIKKDTYRLEIIELPYNDDSVKLLQNIVSKIDKNRDVQTYIPPEELYKFLYEDIIDPNDILSIYIELLIGILYFDEDEVMMRYSNKNIHEQVALKDVISRIDPSMSFFYGFNDNKISDCYEMEDTVTGFDHMYSDLMNIYN